MSSAIREQHSSISIGAVRPQPMEMMTLDMEDPSKPEEYGFVVRSDDSAWMALGADWPELSLLEGDMFLCMEAGNLFEAGDVVYCEHKQDLEEFFAQVARRTEDTVTFEGIDGEPEVTCTLDEVEVVFVVVGVERNNGPISVPFLPRPEDTHTSELTHARVAVLQSVITESTHELENLGRFS
jgi:hypothetical protein